MWPYKVINTENGVRLELETWEETKTFTPEEIAAEFFKYIKTKTQEFQSVELTEAVITIPTSYNNPQKQSLINAAKQGGWRTIYLLPEPIAATFGYCDKVKLEKNKTILVFDLGGGTMNIFILKTLACHLKVLSSDGSLSLGGRDFDTVLINYFNEILIERYRIEVMKDESKKYKFMAECQEIKCDLSYQLESRLDVENYDCASENTITITRTKFEELSLHLLQEIEGITQRALTNSNMNKDQIDIILCVGGGSKVPMIKGFLKNMFPAAAHHCTPHPDEIVAEGAALYACLLKSKYP